MGKWVRSHSLGLAAITLFLLAFAGQVLTGRAEYNQDQRAHGEAPVSLVQYLSTGHFGEATLENWESEFLQMAVFVRGQRHGLRRRPAAVRLHGTRTGGTPARLCSAADRVSLDPMSICARTYRGYRYYGLPNGTPGFAVRV